MRLATLTTALAAGLLLLASPASGQSSLEGLPAPEIQATDFIHGDGRTSLAEFRGQVVLLEFWKTRCGASRGEVRHLVKLADEFAKKGLEVIAITSDDDRPALERFLTHADPSPNFRIAIGGASGYAVTRLPCAVLIGPDGKVLVDAIAGRSMSDRDVEAALKSVRAPSAEEQEARAAKRLAFAESFAAAGNFVRAEYELSRIVKTLPDTPSAKSAAARLKSLADPATAAELDAQRDVAKLANLNATFEHAASKPSSKEAESLAKRLAKKADDLRAKTPKAAAMAQAWAKVYAEPWGDVVRK